MAFSLQWKAVKLSRDNQSITVINIELYQNRYVFYFISNLSIHKNDLCYNTLWNFSFLTCLYLEISESIIAFPVFLRIKAKHRAPDKKFSNKYCREKRYLLFLCEKILTDAYWRAWATIQSSLGGRIVPLSDRERLFKVIND